MVYNGGLGKVKIFVDGVKILTTTKGVTKQASVPWSNPVTVGKLIGNDAEFFFGSMDEFYIFTSALMHAEVEALMTKCEFPSDSKYTCQCRNSLGFFNAPTLFQILLGLNLKAEVVFS